MLLVWQASLFIRTSTRAKTKTNFSSHFLVFYFYIRKLAICTYIEKYQLWNILIELAKRSGPGGVVGIATGYGLDGLGIESWWGGARFFAPVRIGPRAHPASCTMGTGSLPLVKSGRGVTLTPHPLLVPWSWKSRAIPLLALCAVRPVQSLSACTQGAFYL